MHLFTCAFTGYLSQIPQPTLPQAFFLYPLILAIFRYVGEIISPSGRVENSSLSSRHLQMSHPL